MGYSCDAVDHSTARQIVQTGQCPSVQDDPITMERLTDPMVFLCGEGTHREYIKCYNKSTIANMYKNRHTVPFVEPTSRGKFTNAAMAAIRSQIGAELTPQRTPLHVIGAYRPGYRISDSDFFNAVVAGVQSNVKRYLDAGGFVDVKDARGNTALMKAALNGDTQMAMILALHGADINARNNSGMTPLMAAAASGNYNVVDFLLSSGANPRLSMYDGRTAKDFASTDRIRRLFGGPLSTRIDIRVKYKKPTHRRKSSKKRRSKPRKRSKTKKRKRSKSPRRRSKSPRRRSKSPRRRSKSPRKRSASKKRKRSKSRRRR